VKYGGLKFLEAGHIKDLLAVLRWADNPRNTVAAFRVIQLLPGIGPATAAALTTRGVQPDFVPTEFIGESLARGLGPLQGKRILLPRAEGARQALPAGLVEQGASVDEIGIYRAVTPPAPPAGLSQLAQGVEAVTFTSPSTVEGFIRLARQAGVKRLVPFHFSPRYGGEEERLRREAEDAFAS